MYSRRSFLTKLSATLVGAYLIPRFDLFSGQLLDEASSTKTKSVVTQITPVKVQPDLVPIPAGFETIDNPTVEINGYIYQAKSLKLRIHFSSPRNDFWYGRMVTELHQKGFTHIYQIMMVPQNWDQNEFPIRRSLIVRGFKVR